MLVALSGGADSVALLSALTRLGYLCIAAHCNFRLRGEESLRDMRHAEAIAARLGVDIYIREFDVPRRMRQTGESIEMACRELRYEWFHQLLDRDYSQAVAVAHHREDNIETFFLNLLRSSGIAGLTGMDYRNGYVVRPMLDASRAEIERYLADIGLTYITDSSNASNDFKRNRLRNIVLPLLDEHFPGATDAVLSTMRHLTETKSLMDSMLERATAGYTVDDSAFDIASLLRENPEPTAAIMLYELLKPMGLNRTQSDNILRAVAGGNTGLTFKIDSRRFAELDRGILSLHDTTGKNTDETSYAVSLNRDILVPVHIGVTPHAVTEFKPTRNPGVMYLDTKALTGEPVFEIRHPRRGDRMKPFGMTGERLISDILKDAKYTSAQKRETWLLTRNDVVLWVIGLRSSAHFTVTPDTRRYLRLELSP